MNTAFLFAGPLPIEIAEAHVRSVRASIPNAHIIQLSDQTTPKLPFVDEVKRMVFKDLLDSRFAHQEDLHGDTIVLDYDTVVQKDITDVFKQSFDLAVTKRPEGDPTASQSVLALSPHNLGVFFQKDSGKDFWRKVRIAYNSLETDGWLDGQVIVSRCFKELGFNVLELPGEVYNYTPMTEDEDVSMRAVVHYKGLRKAWMVPPEARERARAEGKRVLRIMSGRG